MGVSQKSVSKPVDNDSKHKGVAGGKSSRPGVKTPPEKDPPKKEGE